MARLTSKQYSQAKAMWRSGEYRLKDLSERFDVTEAALHRRFKRDDIKKGSDREIHEKALSQAIENTAASRAEELAKVTTEIKDEILKGTKMLSRRMLYEVARLTKEKQQLGDYLADFKALNEVAKGLQTNYRTASEVLGLNKDMDAGDELPELTVKVMDDEDVAELRRQQREEAEMLVGGKKIDDAEDVEGDQDSLFAEDLEIVEEGAE